eukprot:TRINITY_DN10091_c1_g2_i1.p1 TRINITY_DN10091_c1_g2~~TRINITY_DN10091_c1_g2_i1.p1  ORF type:complete len:121 (-),score=0.73 TRINITY_DN10091_c1_g2_i1:119-481(-)
MELIHALLHFVCQYTSSVLSITFKPDRHSLYKVNMSLLRDKYNFITNEIRQVFNTKFTYITPEGVKYNFTSWKPPYIYLTCLATCNLQSAVSIVQTHNHMARYRRKSGEFDDLQVDRSLE